MVQEEEVMRNITSKGWTEKITAEAQHNVAIKEKLNGMSSHFRWVSRLSKGRKEGKWQNTRAAEVGGQVCLVVVCLKTQFLRCQG
ncbi:putative PEK kinase [Cyclospora cayetanensis]|uniref:PEK kinase n=1 Tax=Cyclospora cayetanensis TaxID=88456 RepID=A0A1D3CUR2_9EIME|nr:putative PEK kinase [Cyclospora cayetanensis]